MKHTALLLIIAASLAWSCKKKDPTPATPPASPGTPPVTTNLESGLPANSTSIDAYLYAGYLTDVSYASDYNLSMFSAFAGSSRNLFTNYDHRNDKQLIPGNADLRGNSDVGNVTFSGNAISKSASPTNSAYYTSSVLSSTTSLTKWKVDGGNGFVATEVDITRGYPLVMAPPATGISVNAGFAFKVSDFISNYDSVNVRLTAYNKAPYGFHVEKTVASSADSIRFTKAELTPAYPSYQYLYLTIKAYNYSHKTISDKKYVFELSNKVYNKPMYLGY
jgi:hypothetical protein